MYKRILVPLDGSSLSETVLPYVIDLSKCTGAEIVLLRIVVSPVYDYMVTDPVIAPIGVQDPEADQEEAEKYLDQIAGRIKGEGLAVRTEACGGPVAETIVEYAERVEASLIAMSTHGRGGVARFLIGSVADRVVRRAAVPVLLVRPASPF